MSDPNEHTGGGTPAGVRDTSGDQTDPKDEGATPSRVPDKGRRGVTDRQDQEGATPSGRRDEDPDAPADRQDDDAATPSGRRDAG